MKTEKFLLSVIIDFLAYRTFSPYVLPYIFEYIYSPTNSSRQVHTINNTKDRQRTEIYKSNTTI